MSNDLGIDRSGNGNNWTVNNITYSDQVVDSPTNNFCTINPLDVETADKLKEGNLYANSGPARCRGTMAVSSGKWYYEMLMVYQHHGTAGCGIRGVGGDKISVETGNDYVYINHPNNSGISINVGGSTTGDLSNGVVSGGSGDSAPGSIIGVMWDMDAETITFKSNNSALASALTDVDFSGISNKETIAPYFLINGGRTAVVNFGQDSSFAGLKTAQGNQDSGGIGDFYYTPPTGFLALCTKNLPDVAVTPSEHFNTVLYTGDGNASRTISGAGFAPDLLWGKIRSTTNNHFWFDTLRGANRLISNGTGAESDYSTWFSTLTSDGFTTGTTNANSMNQNNATFVAWFWKANGSGSSNTDGSSNSTVSANTDAGFSIVSYTGQSGAQTIGHGLSKTPEMIILKNRSDADEWLVYYGYKDNYLRLDTNAAEGDNTFWNDTAPTPSVFSVGDSRPSNSGHGSNYIAYCFHSVDGYSKADGFYIGNASTDGVFNYCGFSPKWIMIKRKNAVNNWYIYDTARTANNPNGTVLLADSSNAEATQTYFQIDILSNGWKARASDGAINTSGEYIYLAFAETPFKYSNAK